MGPYVSDVTSADVHLNHSPVFRVLSESLKESFMLIRLPSADSLPLSIELYLLFFLFNLFSRFFHNLSLKELTMRLYLLVL